MPYSPTLSISQFHYTARFQDGSNTFTPPSSSANLLTSAFNDVYLKGSTILGLIIVVVSAFILGSLLLGQAFICCCHRCKCVGRAPPRWLTIPHLLLAITSSGIAFGCFFQLKALSQGVADTNTALQGLALGLTSLKNQLDAASTTFTTLATTAATFAAQVASPSSLCSPVSGLPTVPCVPNPTITCPPSLYSVCLNTMSPLQQVTTAALNTSTQVSASATTAVAAFSTSIASLNNAIASVPWDTVQTMLGQAGTALAAITVVVCVIHGVTALCAQSLIPGVIFKALSPLGILLSVCLFIIAAAVYVLALVASDFCFSPGDAIQSVVLGPGSPTDLGGATLAFALHCASSPNYPTNGTVVGVIQGAVLGLQGAAGPITSAINSIPSTIQVLALPLSFNALNSALSSSSTSLNSLVLSMSCDTTNKLIDPVLKGVCLQTVDTLDQLARLLIAMACLVSLQFTLAVCMCPCTFKKSGGGNFKAPTWKNNPVLARV